MTRQVYIFDFDSTILTIESLDLLAAKALAEHPEKESILADIKDLTDLAMNGKMEFHEAIERRLHHLALHQDIIEEGIQELKPLLSPSFLRHQQFIRQNQADCYVISAGFLEVIWPLVRELGFQRNQVFGNQLHYDFEGNVVGYQKQNPLAQDRGKAKLLKELNIQAEEIIVVGDGFADYEMKAHGNATIFCAYTEVVCRENVVANADHVCADLDAVFAACNKQNPSEKPIPKVLLLENIHSQAVAKLKQQGFEVTQVSKALSEQELIEKIKTVDFLGIRSKTQITEKVLAQADNLLAIGAFCIGTNQIDLQACLDRGIAVFNAPYSNTRSVVELAIGEIIMLYRRVFLRSQQMHQGEWQKSSDGSHEIRGKTLGIIGYGNIGTQLSILAEALGMQVIYYDVIEKLPMGNAKKCTSMQELLSRADVVSFHVDGNPENHHLLAKAEFAKMKRGALLLNLSRGHVIDLDALNDALAMGQLAGVALDVYEQEPKQSGPGFKNPLQNNPLAILTPHIGGSTKEAQQHIGEFVASRLLDYYVRGASLASVNFPQLQLPEIQGTHRIIHIHRNVPGILAQLNGLFAEHKANIEGQYLKTNEHIGYVITDLSLQDLSTFVKKCIEIPETVKVRVLY